MMMLTSCIYPPPTPSSAPSIPRSEHPAVATQVTNVPDHNVPDHSGPTRSMGLLDDDPAEAFALMRSGNADAAALPVSYDNSAAYPPVGDQGSQGSCVGWAVAYALKSCQENTDGVAYNDSNKFSPAYIYNQINDGMDTGSTFNDAMKLLKEQGVCTLDDMPYSEWDYLTQPNETQRQKAYQYRCVSYFTLSGVNDIKQAIIAYGGVVIGVPMYPAFNSIAPGNPVYSDTSGTASGRHAICLVGYDDSMQAFKFINSWGVDWGIDGYGYVSYDIACQNGSYGYVMWADKKTEPGFTVQFNPGGGMGEMAPISGTVGQNITLPKNTFTNNGAKFKGWYAYSTATGGWLYIKGTEIKYFKGGSQPEGWSKGIVLDGISSKDLGIADKDVVIMTAIWESDSAYTVKFDNNGGQGFMSEITAISGNDWYFPNNQFTKDGMVCLGWYVFSTKLESWVHENNNALYLYKTGNAPPGAKLKIYKEGAKTTGLSPEKDDTLILYAAWETTETFTVMFSSDGGTGYMDPLSIKVSDVFTVPQNGFTKEGKTFAGWSVYLCDKEAFLIQTVMLTGTLREYFYIKGNDKMPDGFEYATLYP
ncbi:MAG: C1 family peptidase, partial [Clostridia bacterium]|nr:C1 family peptidase [Clostridia bacterium]